MNKREKAIKLLEDLKECRPKPLFEDVDKIDKGVMFVLGYLTNNIEKEITAGDIANELKVSTARVAVILNKCEKSGYIKRKSSKNDARKTIVYLLPLGLKKSQEFYEELIKSANYLLDKVGEENMYKFIEISKLMKEAMDNR